MRMCDYGIYKKLIYANEKGDNHTKKLWRIYYNGILVGRLFKRKDDFLFRVCTEPSKKPTFITEKLDSFPSNKKIEEVLIEYGAIPHENK